MKYVTKLPPELVLVAKVVATALCSCGIHPSDAAFVLRKIAEDIEEVYRAGKDDIKMMHEMNVMNRRN